RPRFGPVARQRQVHRLFGPVGPSKSWRNAAQVRRVIPFTRTFPRIPFAFIGSHHSTADHPKLIILKGLLMSPVRRESSVKLTQPQVCRLTKTPAYRTE